MKEFIEISTEWISFVDDVNKRLLIMSHTAWVFNTYARRLKEEKKVCQK